MKSSVFGLILGVSIIFYTLLKTTNDAFIFVNAIALAVVFGGTISVTIITYGITEVSNVFKIFFSVFINSATDDRALAKDLIEISHKVYRNPTVLPQLMQDPKLHPFIIDGLRLIYNNLDRDQIEYVLRNMLRERMLHFKRQVNILQVIAKYPPAFGMIGTIIGLVSVLENLNTVDSAATLGPNMAIALITTLYGLFIANYIFNPIGDHLSASSNQDMKIRRMIIEGILLIKDKNDPIYVSEVINGYLLPSNRLSDQEKNNLMGLTPGVDSP